MIGIYSPPIFFPVFFVCYVTKTANICNSSLTNSNGAEHYLRGYQLCSHLRTYKHFLEPEVSFPHSQELSTCLYPEQELSLVNLLCTNLLCSKCQISYPYSITCNSCLILLKVLSSLVRPIMACRNFTSVDIILISSCFLKSKYSEPHNRTATIET
jgi:hypothetical protein